MAVSCEAPEAPIEDPEPIWPPAEAPPVSEALKANVSIAPEVDHWTSTDVAICAVVDVVACLDGVVALLEGGSGPLKEWALAFWRPSARPLQQAGEDSSCELAPIALKAFPTSPTRPSRLWPGSCSGGPSGTFVAQCGDAVWLVDLRTAAAAVTGPWGGDGARPLKAAASLMFALPERASSAACCLGDDGGLLCTFLVGPADVAQGGPQITQPGQSLRQYPPASLCAFDARRGLRAIADVPRLSEQLQASSGSGRAVCVWRAMLNEIPEEAERGEFLALDLTAAEPSTFCLTRGAGRVGGCALSDGGELLVLQANFSADLPITTHMALELLVWPFGEARPRSPGRRLLTGEHVLTFGFLPSPPERPRRLYATLLAGVDPETVAWELGAESGAAAPAQAPVKLPAAILSRGATLAAQLGAAASEGSEEVLVFGTEDAEALPSIVALRVQKGELHMAAMHRLPLPQPSGCQGLRVEKVAYTHRGQPVTALLCERLEPPCPPDAPLLVHIHGGPAIGVMRSPRMAADATRYPYRHFLIAGYRVFMPLFRGTLGFGDAWAQANIGSQGSVTGDLGDVLAGLDFLHSGHARLKGTIQPARTGIWGGSYGGYMTLRAMSEVPDRFGAGVAMYGFVHNRWMTYEGGDFTWEDEYIVEPPEEGLAANFEIELVEQEVSVGAGEEDAGRAAAAAARRGSATTSSGRSRAGSDSPRVRSASSDVWPLPRHMEASDVFNGLHRISSPLLLMHGERDDICPLSQSQVAFHMLEKQKVPTGLVVYPGEGHGFDKPEHRQDRDRRLLAWFNEHLATDGLGSPPDFRGR